METKHPKISLTNRRNRLEKSLTIRGLSLTPVQVLAHYENGRMSFCRLTGSCFGENTLEIDPRFNQIEGLTG